MEQLKEQQKQAPDELETPSEEHCSEQAQPAESPSQPAVASTPYNLPRYDLPPRVTPFSEPKKAETVPKTPKKSVSTINIILILGALLISLSGFIFAVATWGALNTLFKSLVLISFSVVFFAIHSVSERKLKLPQTGRVFYILGSIFLPSAVVAAGVLKVFGEYFSFAGDGCAAVLALISATVCVPFFKGAHDYKNRFFAATSFYAFSAAIVSIIWQISPNGSITALLTSIFAFGIVLTEPFIQRIFTKLFHEDNIFVKEWNNFVIVNAWLLSVVSLFASEGGFVSAAAFAVFSACFLTKTLADKNSAAGAVAFTFFITAAMFVGFEPREFSEVICVIAATALICGVLSVMGIFPESLKKMLNLLGIIASAVTGVLAMILTIGDVESGGTSPELVIALVAIFAEMLVFALRYRAERYKAMSFAAFLLLSTNIFQMLLGGANLAVYVPALSYAAVLAYFSATRFTPLKKRLYHPANDVISAVYALWCGLVPFLEIPTTCLFVIIFAIILSGLSNHKKISPIICPILTIALAFPISEIFNSNNISIFYEKILPDAISAVIILICVLGIVLLFLKNAESYAKSYRITIFCATVIFTVIALIFSDYAICGFAPFAAVTAYTATYLYKNAFPIGKYGKICLFHGMLLLTAFFAGLQYADPAYTACFPAAAAMLIFAVNAAGTVFGGFEKTAKHTEHFLWYAMPALSGILLWIFREEAFSLEVLFDNKMLIFLAIFGLILLICTLLLSLFRRNTLTLIFPIFMGLLAVNCWRNSLADLIFAAVFGVLGRLLFRRKVREKYCLDVFGTAALLFAISARNAAQGAYWDCWEWASLLTAALLTANLTRREQSAKANRIILTIAAAFLFPLWWSEPFFAVPTLIEVQFNLLPVVIFCVILRFIWRDAPTAVYNFSFISAIISIIVLFIAAMSSGNNFDAVFIGVVLLAMLAVSFVIKRKRWFVLAVASMVVSAVLLSVSRLDSIAWLVYLAIAGAALIALGVVNELKKQQKKSGEDAKLTRFMSDWTW
ncbi:MAG: hypothetical protein NC085_05590 [Muribaculaceae bacterium]|nr:hypothetical protein [Muribaculaceae bacterium]